MCAAGELTVISHRTRFQALPILASMSLCNQIKWLHMTHAQRHTKEHTHRDSFQSQRQLLWPTHIILKIGVSKAAEPQCKSSYPNADDSDLVTWEECINAAAKQLLCGAAKLS